MIVLDTHILVWWSTKSKNLSKNAQKAFAVAKKKHEICISPISLWEVAILIKKRKIDFSTGFTNWRNEIENFSFLRFIPIDNQIAVDSVNLPDFLNKDPADRIIVATAINLGAKLITADKRILKYKDVQTVW